MLRKSYSSSLFSASFAMIPTGCPTRNPRRPAPFRLQRSIAFSTMLTDQITFLYCLRTWCPLKWAYIKETAKWGCKIISF
jgi:hypothetical protein